MDDELRFHFEHLVEKYVSSGLAREEAIRRARLTFGGADEVKEECREARGVQLVETLFQDVRYSLRVLRKSPGFTAVAGLTLALGIGANTAIFSVIDSVLLSPLPYREPQQLVATKQNDSLQNVIDIQRQTRAFSQGGGVNIEAMDYTGGPEPVQVQAAFVNAGLLETLAVPPMLGRIIAPDEDVKGGPRNVVVSYHFWQDLLSSDPRALGKTIPLSGNNYTVIGIMPAGFALPRGHADVFVSLWVAYPEAAPFRGVHFMKTYWRLKPGVTLSQAQTDLSAIDERLAEQYPDEERGRQTLLVPLHQWVVGDVRPAIGSAGRVPRRYRGRNISDWLTRIGMFDTRVGELKSPQAKFAPQPQISGKNGGESLNLHQFARDGVVLLGHVRDAHDGQVIIALDMKETLAKVDQFENDTLKLVDDYILRTGLCAPPEAVPQLRDGYEQAQITELDLNAAGISTVIWATGYTFDFSLVKLPVVDSDGYPVQKRGVTRFEGL